MTGGDLTRSTFVPVRHFSGVRMQQGRVQVDADWNEQVDIRAHRDRATGTDTIGAAGAPKVGGGFQLALTPDGTDLAVSPGRLYVEGTLCELDGEPTGVTALQATGATVDQVVLDGRELAPNQWVALSGGGTVVAVRLGAVDAEQREVTFATAIDPTPLTGEVRLRRVVTYATQPDLPEPAQTSQANPAAPRELDLGDGLWLAYLDVWQRTVTALEEPAIREVALGGPDTATRTRTVAQVKLLSLGTPATPVDCDSQLDAWDDLLAPTGGRMAASTTETPPADTPCILPPGGGFQGLENQLYRVQIHSVATDGSATFKWSRENASVAVPWLGRDADELTVAHPGRDRALGFAAGDWVELTGDERELRGEPGTLVRLLKAEGETLFVDEATADGPLDHAGFPGHPKVRRWDSDGAVPLQRDVLIELEDGVQVLFPSGGGYRAGDHWLVAARTAIADVEWPRDSSGRALPQLPHGTRHAYARLALVQVSGGAVVGVSDCRDRFPALTALEATDVAYDNSTCQLAGTHTVQDAIDRLCQERDLRFHNKHLHGWGIVCGLEGHCGPDPEGEPRRSVTVLPGYAIDAEGDDRTIDDPVVVDVMSEVERLVEAGEMVLDENGNGEVCLRLATDAELRTVVATEPFTPEPEPPPAWLNGTLLLDFYNDCVKALHDWLREQLTPPPGEEGKPAGPASQRLSALVNLATQAANPTSGRNIFISPREDELIREFYAGLRERLRSETFCALFDDARPLPDYPFADLGLDTIFATGRHERLRLHPDGRQAFSLGPGLDPRKPSATINRYDLVAGEQIAVIDPVAGTQQTAASGDTGVGAVQDVAFSPDGRRIFVTVATRNQEDTIFRAGFLDDRGITWQPAVTICGVKLVTLATTAADPGNVYAVGHKRITVTEDGDSEERWVGAGLFRINPDEIDPAALPPVPISGFAPTGHLVTTPEGQAALTGTAPDEPVDRYTQLAWVDLSEGGELAPRINLPTGGSDDIALVRLRAGAQPHLFAVVDAPTGGGEAKFVNGYDLRDGSQTHAIAVAGPLTRMRLAGVGTRVLATLEDRYQAVLLDPATGEQVAGFVMPLQVAPISIAHAEGGASVYVLNRLSNTISVVPAKLVAPGFQFPVEDLVNYRKAMLEAFTDLLGGFLQYLKDCLADLLLVKCPEPTGDEKLYLALVSIRGEQVYKVCNFSRRRYVKSFPTVGYWLSLVPVLPFLRKMLEEAACAVLGDYFGSVTVPGFGEEGELQSDRISVASLDQLIAWAHVNDPLGTLNSFRSQAPSKVPTLATSLMGPRHAPAAVAAPAPAGDLEARVNTLTTTMAERDAELASLRTALTERDQTLTALTSRLDALEAARPATRRRTPRPPSN